MAKSTIYDEFVGKYVRLITANDSFLGYLKEINFERATLDPSLIGQSTVLGARYNVGGKTLLDYRVIIGAQEVEESYLKQICVDAQTKMDKEKIMNGPKEGFLKKLDDAVETSLSSEEKK